MITTDTQPSLVQISALTGLLIMAYCYHAAIRDSLGKKASRLKQGLMIIKLKHSFGLFILLPNFLLGAADDRCVRRLMSAEECGIFN